MNKQLPKDKLAYSIEEFGRLTGLSRSGIEQEFKSGALKSFKVGRRRLIAATAAKEWLESKGEDADGH